MANIEKRVTKDGRRVYKFRCLVGKDARGKQKFEYTTWKPPEGLTAAKEKKLAEAEAYRWEQELKHGGTPTGGEYTTPLPEAQNDVQSVDFIPDEKTFRYFAEEIWMPLKVVGGGLRPSTISMYGFMLKVMIPKLGDKRLTEISSVDIMRYLQYLRDEYKAPDGRTLSEKSVKHHFNPEKTIHPCQFPIELVERCVLALTNENDIVFDPFAGVGSSLIAALKNNRQAIGTELVQEYINVGEERIAKLAANALKTRPIYQRIYEPSGKDKISTYPLEWLEKRLQELKAMQEELNKEIDEISKDISSRA